MSGSGRHRKQLPKFYSTCRKLRNEAERQRRDRLNCLVNELAGLVPFVSHAQKKVDKTSILRLTAAYLRLHKIVENPNLNLKCVPSDLLNETALRSVCNGIGGFLLVVTSSGKVIYASEAIEDTFEYFQSDVLGRCLYSMIHPDDIPLLCSQLQPKEDDSGRRSFYCRLLKKNTSRNDSSSYEIINVKGQLKPFPLASNGSNDSRVNVSTTLQTKKRRSCSRENIDQENRPTVGSSANSFQIMEALGCKRDPADTHMLVAFVEVVRDRPITELLWVESMRDEYITRHKIDGSIAYVDHRISFVTGFMPEEVVGSSAFHFIHQEDVPWSLFAQIAMFENSEGKGITTYRLRCKDGSCVGLRSRGFMEVNKETGKVDTFICINTVLSVKELDEDKKTQQKKMQALIEGKSPGDVFEAICNKLPSDLNALVKCLMNQNTFGQLLQAASITEVDPKNECPLPIQAPATSEESFNMDSEIAQVSANETELYDPISRINSKTKCSLMPHTTTPHKKMRTRNVIPASPEVLEDEFTLPKAEAAPLPSLSFEQPIEVPTSEPFLLDSYSVMDPLLNFRQEEVSLDFENETFRAIRSFQPSISEIENWGYPTDGANVPTSSSVVNKPNTSLPF